MKKKLLTLAMAAGVVVGGSTPALAGADLRNNHTAVDFCKAERPSIHFPMGYFTLPCWLVF